MRRELQRERSVRVQRYERPQMAPNGWNTGTWGETQKKWLEK